MPRRSRKRFAEKYLAEREEEEGEFLPSLSLSKKSLDVNTVDSDHISDTPSDAYDGEYIHGKDDERTDDPPSRNRRAGMRSRQGKSHKAARNTRDDNASIESQPTIFDGFEECENELGRDIPESGSVHNNRAGKDKRDVGEKLLRSKHTAACKYLRNGDFSKSLHLFEDILNTLIEKYGEMHHRVGAAMHNIGIVYLRSGNLDDALEAMENAVNVRKTTLGKKHPKVADSLVEMGIILLSMKEYEDSLDIFNEALEMREREVAKSRSGDERKQLLVAKILNNIGCVYFEHGDMRAARKTFLEALKIQEEILGDVDPTQEPGVLSMASTMCNIGYVYLEKNRYNEAIDVLEEGLAIQESVLDDDNRLVLNTLDNLAYACAKDGNFDEAMKYYNEILDAQESLGTEHFDVSSTLQKMTYIHLKLFQHDEAMIKLLWIQRIQEKHLDPRGRDVIGTKKLINAVNYQLLKFHNPRDSLIMALTKQGVKNPFTCRTIEYTFLGKVSDAIDVRVFAIKKPLNSSKMSGHKITYA